MRITRDALMKVVRQTVSRRTRSSRGLMAIYLCGSLLEEDYLLGGTTDIDLVLVHVDQPEQEREIVRLTDDVHLDIAHHLHKDYRNTRKLREHPWLGPTVFHCQVLYDPQHFMDFTQASVRGQFDRTEHVLSRSRSQAEHARQIWFGLSEGDPEDPIEYFWTYLRAVEHAANAVALLSGPPLPERRFLLGFPQRAANVHWEGLYPGLLGLLGGSQVDRETVESWLPLWEAAYTEAGGAGDIPRLHPARFAYYRKGIEALLLREPPLALWPLLRTWTLAVRELSSQEGALEEGGRQLESQKKAELMNVLEHLQLVDRRVRALDAYLDNVEETIDRWARERGAFY